jgi:hypothetical protein
MSKIVNIHSLCLSDEEVREITDTPIRALQILWLKDHGWPFELSRLGRPKVARAFFERRMGVQDGETSPSTEPNWDAVEALNGGAT